MAVSRSWIIGTVDQGDGTVVVSGTDGHGNYAQVHCGLDKLLNGSIYPMLDAALTKVDRVKRALGQADADNRDEGA